MTLEEQLAALTKRVREQDEELAEYRAYCVKPVPEDDDRDRLLKMRLIRARLKAVRNTRLGWVDLLLAFLDAPGRTLNRDHLMSRMRRLKDARSPIVVDVALGDLRRAIRPYGVAVDTEYGLGWRISKEDCARLRELLAGLLD